MASDYRSSDPLSVNTNTADTDYENIFMYVEKVILYLNSQKQQCLGSGSVTLWFQETKTTIRAC